MTTLHPGILSPFLYLFFPKLGRQCPGYAGMPSKRCRINCNQLEKKKGVGTPVGFTAICSMRGSVLRIFKNYLENGGLVRVKYRGGRPDEEFYRQQHNLFLHQDLQACTFSAQMPEKRDAAAAAAAPPSTRSHLTSSASGGTGFQ